MINQTGKTQLAKFCLGSICIKCQVISRKDVVATDPLVKDNHECLKIGISAIKKQFKEMMLREGGSKLISVGRLANSIKVLEFYNFSGSSKLVYLDLLSPACYSKSSELNGYIYSIGDV